MHRPKRALRKANARPRFILSGNFPLCPLQPWQALHLPKPLASALPPNPPTTNRDQSTGTWLQAGCLSLASGASRSRWELRAGLSHCHTADKIF
jgi:hypothetical protein